MTEIESSLQEKRSFNPSDNFSSNAKVKSLKEYFEICEESEKNYEKFFSNPIEFNGCKTAWLAFPILIKKEANFTRREFQIYLEERKIQTRVVFTGNILRQPMCKNINKKIRKEGYPNADAIMERGVLLPLHHGMTKDMFKRLHECIDNFIALKS